MDTYTIKQMSERFEIPASTLRYYEEIGLLKDVVHNEKRQRVYTKEHMERLKAIKCFKRTGLSIEDMMDFFEYEKNLEQNAGKITRLMTNHEEDILHKMAELEEGLAHIRHKVWYYTEIQKAIEENTEWPHWEDYNIK